jgi:hypothetical protein
MIRLARTVLYVIFRAIAGLSAALIGLGAVVAAVQFLGLDHDAHAPPVGESVIALGILAVIAWIAHSLAEWLEPPPRRENLARFNRVR